MIEKPAIADEKIINALSANYSIQVNKIEFLPIGNDASSFSYHVEAKDGSLYFLKVKTKSPDLAGLFVPRFLADKGIEQVVAPLYTKTHKLSGDLDEFSVILYPFISGNEAMEIGMTDVQWRELGFVLKQIHHTEIPVELSQYVKREKFIPNWGSVAKELQEQINRQNYEDPYQKELARFWKEKQETIQIILERAEFTGKQLQPVDLEFVLCHADIHTANILITDQQELNIVDWDDTLLAPKERDLMFILERDRIQTREEHMFFGGYGNVEIHQLALAYYRYEWCVQEIGDFGKRVFWMDDTGETTKQHAVEGFMQLFSKNDVVEVALNTSIDSYGKESFIRGQV